MLVCVRKKLLSMEVYTSWDMSAVGTSSMFCKRHVEVDVLFYVLHACSGVP